MRFLNLGGGFGIPYFPGETAAGPGADRRQPAGARRSARAGELPRGAARHRTRPLPRRRGRRLRHAASSTARSRAGRSSSSATAACTTTWRPAATSAR
ncbi:MAG: hypothetical protein MZW92_21485 [Comamonadaceae bacterium]|nr:hypothetical protein [Comamonadaceae bacterium]